MSLKMRGARKIVQAQDRRGDRAEHGCAAAILVERIHAKTRELRNFEREVGLEKLFEVLTLFVVHDVVYHTVHFLVLQCWHVDSLDIAVDANDRRHSRRQVQIRGVVLDCEREQLRDIYGGHGDPLRKHGSWRRAGLHKALLV